MWKLIIAGILSALCFSGKAQENHNWEKYYEELYNIDEISSESKEQTYDILSDLAQNKINLNTATKEDIERIPFLNEQQVQDIMEYLYKYHPIRSLGELAMIESMDYLYMRLMPYFVYAGPEVDKGYPTLKDIIKYGRNEVVATVSLPTYKREGFKKGYLYNSVKNWWRYTFTFGQWLKAGIVASEDAGEPFFNGRNNIGYDYYSFYLLIHKLSRIKSLAVGRYRLNFGLGLVLNNDFGFGKIGALQNLTRSSNNIRAHTSRSSGNYLQGAAATVNIFKGMDITGFLSYRAIDATLSDTGTISSIIKTGYHRTKSEMSHKNNTDQFLGGGNLHYFNNGFHVGTTALYTSLNHPLAPKISQTYRYWNASGSTFWNASIDYGYISHKLTVNGETATGNCHAVATLNSISYMLRNNLTIMAVHRYYSYKYYSLFSESFCDGSNVQNENGAYLGFNWQTSRYITMTGYSDYAYLKWPRYQQSLPGAHSYDEMLQVSYHRENGFSILARYRLRMRQYDNKDKTALINRNEHHGRLQADYSWSGLSMHTQADISYTKESDKSIGWMLSQNIGYNHKRLKMTAGFGYFDTDDYQSRVYAYEQGVMYNFSFPEFYGNGIRYFLNIRTDINKNVMLIAKIGTTDYFDRNHISSSYQQINHSSQTDIDMQLRWKF